MAYGWRCCLNPFSVNLIDKNVGVKHGYCPQHVKRCTAHCNRTVNIFSCKEICLLQPSIRCNWTRCKRDLVYSDWDLIVYHDTPSRWRQDEYYINNRTLPFPLWLVLVKRNLHQAELRGLWRGHLSDKSQLKGYSYSIQTFYPRKQMIKFTANIKSFSDIFSTTKWQIIVPFCQPSFIQTKVCSMLSFSLFNTNGTPSTLRLHSSVNQLIAQTRKLYGDGFTGGQVYLTLI